MNEQPVSPETKGTAASAYKEAVRVRNRLRLPGLAAVFSTYFSSFFFSSLISNSLPRISAELNGMQLYSWAIALPALATAFATLIFGKLSDIFGRKVILLTSLGFMLVGTTLCSVSSSFPFLAGALCLASLGAGSLMPLCFSVIGDMFLPAERAKWAGLLSLTSGLTALIGPTLAGWFVDNPGWRYIFWSSLPLILLAGILALRGIPTRVEKHEHKIDFLGAVCVALASGSLIIAFSWAGNLYPWFSLPVLGLLGGSALFWLLFARIEIRAPEPVLDPRVLKNRTFLTAALAAVFSMFGITTLNYYFPLFLQGVRQTSATLSGQLLTPFTALSSLMGLPAGFILAKTRRYKWIYVSGYALLTVGMGAAVFLAPRTPFPLIVALSAWAGLGLGSIPTINAMVVQYAVPRRLLGSATGSFYFFLMMGRAVSPAILGSVINSTYRREVAARIPAEIAASAAPSVLQSISNPRLLLSASSMGDLQQAVLATGEKGQALFDQLTTGMRIALGLGLRSLFLISAIAMLVSLLVIIFIPEINLESHEEE